MSDTTPAIYVADLAAYNAGTLHGQWIALDDSMDADELHSIIAGILLPGHEEWAIHDYEGFGPIKISEYDSMDTIAGHVERMADEPEKYFAWMEACCDADAFDADMVHGPYESEDDIAWDDLDNFIGSDTLSDWLVKQGLPESLASAIKFDAEDYVFSLRCNTGASVVRVNGSYYMVEG